MSVKSPIQIRIGIDVGGTNTDAVAMRGSDVLSWHKTPTTSNVTDGIVSALRGVLSQPGMSTAQISALMIGTTHFTNALVETTRLLPTAAIRVALPATQALPPMVGWPERLKQAVGGHSYLVHGGSEFDGRDLAALDEMEIRNAAADIRSKGITAVAITSVFSPVKAAIEEYVATIVEAEIPGVSITRSADIGRIGLLERENAAILNGSLTRLAAEVVGGFRQALNSLNIAAPFFITQNDGTLMSAEFAEQYPVLTIASGPTNSMRGAAFLSGVSSGVVVDVGGTTTDVGMLVNGFPREASTAVEIGQVRTNFRMPDVLSIGIGGGSIVDCDNELTVGPKSVGYQLQRRGLAFGGDTLTVTDAAVAAGMVGLGERSRVSHLNHELVERIIGHVHDRIDETIGRVKTSPEPVSVVLVGGGAVLVNRHLSNAREVLHPKHAEVANAIGAAIAQVGGQVDRVFSLTGSANRSQALDEAKAEARQRAISAGAVPESVNIVDVDEVPLTYLPGNAVRIRVKAVGDLGI